MFEQKFNFSTEEELQILQLTQKYQTPLFVLDESVLESRILNMQKVLDEHFVKNQIEYKTYYASKAFLCKKIASQIANFGLGLDTCSLVEAKTAITAGVSGKVIGLHGNNKSDDEIIYAIINQFDRIVIDSEDEIDRIDYLVKRICQESSQNIQANVMLRITTGIHAGGHEYISTAHEDQKFGISIEGSKALNALKKILKYETLNLKGIHTHIGSQITSHQAYIESINKMLELRYNLYLETNYLLDEIDAGGGFGIQYVPDDDIFDINDMAEAVSNQILEYNQEHPNCALQKVSFEPGRFLIGPAMKTVYTVGAVKDVEVGHGVVRKYISVDGGMSDNIRPILYGAKYWCSLIKSHQISGESSSSDEVLCRIVGKHCESGDILIDDVMLPKTIKRGDLLVIHVTGAYGYSMASNYNMLLKPAVVKVSNSGDCILIPRQSEEELIK